MMYVAKAVHANSALVQHFIEGDNSSIARSRVELQVARAEEVATIVARVTPCQLVG